MSVSYMYVLSTSYIGTGNTYQFRRIFEIRLAHDTADASSPCRNSSQEARVADVGTAACYMSVISNLYTTKNENIYQSIQFNSYKRHRTQYVTQQTNKQARKEPEAGMGKKLPG